MSEADVSRSWTHNSTAHSYFTNTLDKSHHILMSRYHSVCLSVKSWIWSSNKFHKDLCVRWFHLIIFVLFSLNRQTEIHSANEWPQMRCDFHTSRNSLHLLFCDVSGDDDNLMLHIFSSTTYFSIKPQTKVHQPFKLQSEIWGNIFFFFGC